ncbi:hypothetical protein TSMEX_008541 [Taenia solium]|eukprot:TsM_000875500 transcript=TsM_000875500 gene=TsM_000875500
MKDIDREHDCSKRLLTLPVPHIDDNPGVPFYAEVRYIHLLATMPMAHTHTPPTDVDDDVALFRLGRSAMLVWSADPPGRRDFHRALSLATGGAGKQLPQPINTTIVAIVIGIRSAYGHAAMCIFSARLKLPHCQLGIVFHSYHLSKGDTSAATVVIYTRREHCMTLEVFDDLYLWADALLDNHICVDFLSWFGLISFAPTQ